MIKSLTKQNMNILNYYLSTIKINIIFYIWKIIFWSKNQNIKISVFLSQIFPRFQAHIRANPKNGFKLATIRHTSGTIQSKMRQVSSTQPHNSAWLSLSFRSQVLKYLQKAGKSFISSGFLPLNVLNLPNKTKICHKIIRIRPGFIHANPESGTFRINTLSTSAGFKPAFCTSSASCPSESAISVQSHPEIFISYKDFRLSSPRTGFLSVYAASECSKPLQTANICPFSAVFLENAFI